MSTSWINWDSPLLNVTMISLSLVVPESATVIVWSTVLRMSTVTLPPPEIVAGSIPEYLMTVGPRVIVPDCGPVMVETT